MSIEESVKYFELCLKENAVDREDITPLRVLINAVKNSVSKDKIRETIDRYSMNLEFDYRPMEVIETKEINKLLEE